jgi:hypothetical protein
MTPVSSSAARGGWIPPHLLARLGRSLLASRFSRTHYSHLAVVVSDGLPPRVLSKTELGLELAGDDLEVLARDVSSRHGAVLLVVSDNQESSGAHVWSFDANAAVRAARGGR